MEKKDIENLMKTLNEPQLFETHISFVILSGDFAYKIKKPAKFSFLDFSTLDKRKFFCEEEVRLNNRLTNGIYLGVVQVIKERQKSRYQIKDGERKYERFGIEKNLCYYPMLSQLRLEEYAIKMRRLDQEKKMDNLLKKKKVTKKQILELAKKIADFHNNTEIERSGYNSQKMITEQVMDLGNFTDVIEKACGRKKDVEKILNASSKFIENNTHLLAERIKEGFIRDCHGDLHSGNIFIEEEIYPIDCIEFSKDFRIIDVISEIAFMAMDLDSFGFDEYSKAFVAEYLKHFKDSKGLKLLGFYKCYRANVRAKIAAIGWQYEKNVNVKDSHVKAINKYLDLAIRYCS